MDADPVAIASAVSSAMIGAFATWSHFFSKRNGKNHNSNSRTREDDTPSETPIRKKQNSSEVARHIDGELAVLKTSVDELKEQVGEMREDLKEIQRSIGRLEGRSNSD